MSGEREFKASNLVFQTDDAGGKIWAVGVAKLFSENTSRRRFWEKPVSPLASEKNYQKEEKRKNFRGNRSFLLPTLFSLLLTSSFSPRPLSPGWPINIRKGKKL